MDLQAFDHNLHQSDNTHTHTLHTDLDSALDLHDRQDLLNDPNLGVHHDPFDLSSIGIDEPHHIHNAFDNQHLADSYSDFNAMSQSIAVDQHPQSFEHDHFLTDSHSDHLLQRSGTANVTPSSTADISKNKEVTFKDADGNEQHGTVIDTHGDNTYKVQTSDKTYDNVAYHDIQKYGSK